VLTNSGGGFYACCTEDIGDTRDDDPFEVGDYNGHTVYAVCAAGNGHVANCGFHPFSGGRRSNFDPNKPGKFQCGTWLFYTQSEFDAYKAEQSWIPPDIDATPPRSPNEFTDWTYAEAEGACQIVGNAALGNANRCGINYFVSSKGLQGYGMPPDCYCNTSHLSHCLNTILPDCIDEDGNPIIQNWCNDGNPLPTPQ
jgi:hypothetical protein